MSRVLADHAVFEDLSRWDQEDPGRRVEQAVRDVVRIFSVHADFLRAVVLISGAHPEVRRRGEAYRRAISELFVQVLSPVGTSRAEREFCFSLLFSMLVLRTAFGPGFGPRPETDDTELVTMAQRYLRTDPA